MYSMHEFGGVIGFLLILRVIMVLLLPILLIIAVVLIFTHKKKPSEPKPSQTLFGERLKELRTLKGSSIEEASEALHLAPFVYNRFETGALEPHLEDLVKLADYFEISCDELLRNETKEGINVSHIALYVNDLEGAKGFFETYFNASAGAIYQNTTTEFSSYFLSFDSGARVELMHKPMMEDEKKSQLRTGYSHLALSVGSKEAVDALTTRLQEDGYQVVSGPRTTGDGYYESCIVGFEENLIEITV